MDQSFNDILKATWICMKNCILRAVLMFDTEYDSLNIVLQFN